MRDNTIEQWKDLLCEQTPYEMAQTIVAQLGWRVEAEFTEPRLQELGKAINAIMLLAR